MTETDVTRSSRRRGNRIYDAFKFIALIVLPALGTLYFALAQIWDLPNADKVVGTIVAIDTFLGVVLQISNHQYYKSGKNFDGEINFIQREGEDEKVRFEINKDPVDVIHDEPGKHSFEFRVNKLSERDST
jgi:hypothetical protein